MAEIWPRLRKKLQRLKSKSSKKPNPYASIGLEKFASLLEEIRFKQQAATSLVERTASTLSAARSISRSAQEWTASTLVRTIHDTTTGVKASPSPAGGAPIVAGEPQRNEESKHQSQPKVEEPVNTLKSFASSPLDLLKKTASSPLDLLKKTASSPLDLLKKTASTPLGLRLPVTRCRLMTSKSAFVLGFVALGTFLSSRAGKVGRALFAAFSFSGVIRNWRKWKYSARFLLSSVALYLLFPLRGYLSTRMPEAQLISPPSSRSNLAVEEVVLVREPPVVLPLISSIPENRSASEIECLPRQARVSLPRRVAKKISSQFKNLKPRMFRSSPSSHHRLKMCPLSRKASDITSEVQSTRSLQRKCKVVMLRQDSSEHCSHQGESTIASEFSKHSSRVDHHQDSGNVAWPLVGLLVTLLFLLVGRVPAIMATSFSFVVVSPHSRARAGSRRGSNPDHR